MIKEMLSVRIPKEMNAQLTKYLQTIGVTKNSFILGLIREALNKELELKSKQEQR